MNVVIVLFFVAGIVLFWRARQDSPARASRIRSKNNTPAQRKKNPFAAVRIEAGLNCIESERSVRGQVWLSKDAPNLPLESCNQMACQCRYVCLDDRRQEVDRRTTYAAAANQQVDDPNWIQRQHQGRRHSEPTMPAGCA